MKTFSKLINESNSGSFRLGCDLHGVIDSMPDFFAFLTNSFIKNGGEVHIITGGSWTDQLESQLRGYGIKWTHHFSIYDHLVEIGTPSIGKVQFPDGTIQDKFPNDIWDKVKGDYCRDNGISLHIDDTLIYNSNFTTPFARLWTHSGQSKAPHKDVRHLD
jgi:hypothetical protein